jgi:membrane-associated phospholipid phosphatase
MHAFRHTTRLRGIAVCLLVIVAALPLDTILHDLTFRYVVNHGVRLVANGVTELGTAWATAGLLGALAVVGHRTADLGLFRASVGGLAGVATGSLGIQVVKHVACRARPRLVDGWGIDDVGPGAGLPPTPSHVGFFHWPCVWDTRYHSFPSGHATLAFAVAAALTRMVPGRRRAWLGIASGVGLSRVLLNAHFLSDVLSGAILGWWAGQFGLWLAQRFIPVPARLASMRAAVEPGGEAGAPSA